MSYTITEDCTSCGACESECPNSAISDGSDIYVIDPSKCSECVGFFDTPQCSTVCPVDCCAPDESRLEDEALLIAKVKKLYPDKDFSGPIPSRFTA